MKANDLGTYLQDHYAGSVGAVELVDHLIDSHAGEPLELFFRELRAEISSDQEELRDLMRALNISESSVKNAGARIAEKFSEIKLGVAGEKQGGLGLLQALEALVLGITGKQLLWPAIAEALNNSTQFPPVDFARLEQRASDQWNRVEAKRLETARQTFA